MLFVITDISLLLTLLIVTNCFVKYSFKDFHEYIFWHEKWTNTSKLTIFFFKSKTLETKASL